MNESLHRDALRVGGPRGNLAVSHASYAAIAGRSSSCIVAWWSGLPCWNCKRLPRLRQWPRLCALEFVGDLHQTATLRTTTDVTLVVLNRGIWLPACARRPRRRVVAARFKPTVRQGPEETSMVAAAS